MNIGIVLSGGMAKGAYQIGALKAIRENINIDDIKCMSCASIGVLNGYSFLMNRLDDAEKMYLSLCSDNSRLFINQILRSSILHKSIYICIICRWSSMFFQMYSLWLSFESIAVFHCLFQGYFT